MMLLEQLVTAGTVTELCVWRMVRQYKRMLRKQGSPGLWKHWSTSTQRIADIEQGRTGVGRLHVSYFKPQPGKTAVKCHIKCSIIDNAVAVLGSGNMDRASWFTSQELGIALEGEDAVRRVMLELHEAKSESFEYRYNPT
jgi:phosphatidylserine/phosphatidylglycerophosphate/cardiolipin synthase-like enzyme